MFLYLSVLIVPLNPVIHYVLHKNYYAEILCENKKKPKMHCEGKCHLKKEIKEKENNNSNPNPSQPIPKTEIDIFPVFIKHSTIYLCSILNKGISSNSYNIPCLKDIYQEVITPPPEV